MSGATRSDRGKLGGLVRAKLIRELALAEMNQRALAEKYDVTEGAITQFKARNADAIAEVRADSENEFAGLLIAQKVNRVGTLEDIVNRALTPTPKVDNRGNQVRDPETHEPVYEINASAALAAIKQAAEEMGQLVARTQVTGDLTTTTTYRIENVSDEDLT